MNKLDYFIATTWDSHKVDHEPIQISVEAAAAADPNFVSIHISASYFNSPSEPAGFKPGEFFNLWDYEGEEISSLQTAEIYVLQPK